MYRGCHFSRTTVGNVEIVCPFKITKMRVVPLLLWETGLQHWEAKCFLVAAVFFRGCVLLKCLSLLELSGYCKATWNDSWVWQMSGTAGCVLDYPKSLDNAVIHHCPNYLCIDCRSLCDSTVMANYPGYLWYLLYSALEEFKKRRQRKRKGKNWSKIIPVKDTLLCILKQYMLYSTWDYTAWAIYIQPVLWKWSDFQQNR